MSIVHAEMVSITLAASSTTGTTNLPAAFTDTAECFPMSAGAYFTTLPSTVDDPEAFCYDIDFLTGPNRIRATTDKGTTRAMVVNVGVIQFDGTTTSVESGTWSIGDTASSTTASPTAATPANGMHSWFWTADSDVTDAMEYWGVGAELTANTITFTRSRTSGVTAGHWYLAYGDGTDFTVQHNATTIANSVASGNWNHTDVADDKSFIIGGHYDGTGDEPESNCFDIVANITTGDITDIDYDRLSGGSLSGGITFTSQLVTLGGSGSVYRNTGTVAANTATNTVSISGLSSTDNCTIHHPGKTSTNQTFAMTDTAPTTDVDAVPDTFIAWTLTNNTTATWNKSVNEAVMAGSAYYEIVEWPVASARRVMVIS